MRYISLSLIPSHFIKFDFVGFVDLAMSHSYIDLGIFKDWESFDCQPDICLFP